MDELLTRIDNWIDARLDTRAGAAAFFAALALTLVAALSGACLMSGAAGPARRPACAAPAGTGQSR